MIEKKIIEEEINKFKSIYNVEFRTLKGFYDFLFDTTNNINIGFFGLLEIKVVDNYSNLKLNKDQERKIIYFVLDKIFPNFNIPYIIANNDDFDVIYLYYCLYWLKKNFVDDIKLLNVIFD